jgi:hypothetical protein
MIYQFLMAKLSDLVRVVAHTGVGVASTTIVGRVLRERGLIATNGRGRNGANMGGADAANLLLGVVTLGDSTKAADVVSALGATPLNRAQSTRARVVIPMEDDMLDQVFPIAGAPLGEALATLLNALSVGPFFPPTDEGPWADEHGPSDESDEDWDPRIGDSTPVAIALTLQKEGVEWDAQVDVDLANGAKLNLGYLQPKTQADDPFVAATRMRQTTVLPSACVNAVVRCLRGFPDYDPAIDGTGA